MIIPFINLKNIFYNFKNSFNKSILDVVSSSFFVMGNNNKLLNKKILKFCKVNNFISCANGTDALKIILLGCGVGIGDYIIISSFSFIASASVIIQIGAIPIFVDVEDDFNISINSLKTAILDCKKNNIIIKVIIAIDMFGKPCNYYDLNRISKENNILLISDSAQSMGAMYYNYPVNYFSHASSLSFYPTKPLGTFGDGGGIITNDKKLANILKTLCLHGYNSLYNNYLKIGYNSRLDEIHASLLLEKMHFFKDFLIKRRKTAYYYNDNIKNKNIILPSVDNHIISTWAQYTIRTTMRDDLIKILKKYGIGYNIYYKKSLILEKCFKKYLVVSSNILNSIKLSKQAISIPIYHKLTIDQQKYIIYILNKFNI